MSFGGFAAVVVITAAIGGALWLVRKGRQWQEQADFDRRVRARKLGWRYDGTRDGRIDYRFEGSRAGVAWAMWYDSDRGDDSPTPKGIWVTENLRTPRLSLLILGKRRYGLESGMFGRLVMGVVSGLASAATGREGAPDKVEFYESAVVIDSVRPAFADRFTAAVTPDMPRGWLDEELQERLARWPDTAGGRPFAADDAVEVNLGPRGLSIVVQKMPEHMNHWQHLAALGEALAARLAGASRHGAA